MLKGIGFNMHVDANRHDVNITEEAGNYIKPWALR
jgi:hypothetical protein